MLSDPLYLFVFLGLFSPGPNVILLTASGARFGFVRTLPHLLGVAAGVGVTAGITGLGVGSILTAAPTLGLGLAVLSALWILFMAWQLWNATPGAPSDRDRPMSFVEAVLFQWVNPKVWAVAFAAVAAFPSDMSPWGEALRLGSAFSGINLGVCLFWTAFGHLVSRLLKAPLAWRIFNRSMAIALVAFSALLFV
ncbi:LysE family translocator [Primorskyibacter sp. S187A]|uniref:LysE family translocator n=1 Tax=Primorskyibacter sp. S187A TaxID=3415130 RepID=UPI003C7E3868